MTSTMNTSSKVYSSRGSTGQSDALWAHSKTRRKMPLSIILHVTQQHGPTCNKNPVRQTSFTLQTGLATVLKAQMIWGGLQSQHGSHTSTQTQKQHLQYSRRCRPLPDRSLQVSSPGWRVMSHRAYQTHHRHGIPSIVYSVLTQQIVSLQGEFTPEKFLVVLKNQCSTNLLALLSRQSNQPYRQLLQKSLKSPGRNRPRPFLLPCHSWSDQLLEELLSKKFPQTSRKIHSKNKDEWNTYGALQNLRQFFWWPSPWPVDKFHCDEGHRRGNHRFHYHHRSSWQECRQCPPESFNQQPWVPRQVLHMQPTLHMTRSHMKWVPSSIDPITLLGDLWTSRKIYLR